MHADETGTRVRTTGHWVHTLATSLLTLVGVPQAWHRGHQRHRGVPAVTAAGGTRPGHKAWDLATRMRRDADQVLLLDGHPGAAHEQHCRTSAPGW